MDAAWHSLGFHLFRKRWRDDNKLLVAMRLNQLAWTWLEFKET